MEKQIPEVPHREVKFQHLSQAQASSEAQATETNKLSYQQSMMVRTALKSSMVATLLKYQFLELEAQGSGFQSQATLHGDFLDRLGYRVRPCLKKPK